MACIARAGASGRSIWKTEKWTGVASLVAFALLLPTSAFAEGGSQSIACTGNAVCDASGTCTEGAPDVAFRLTPMDVTETGDGAYRVAYDQVDAEAVMRPDKSLIWAEGRGDVQMLTLMDATRAIWVRRATLGMEGGTSVTFLTCGEAG